MLKNLKRSVPVVALLPLSAQAQIDTTAVVTEIGNVTTAVAAIGGALLLVAATVLAYRWVKAQFF